MNLQKIIREITALNQSEPSGTVSDYVEQLSKKEVEARTVAGVEYHTFELAEKARANRNAAQALMGTCTNDPTKKAEVLEKLCAINNAEPKGSVLDCVETVLVKFFGRKESEDQRVFFGNTYSSILERQNVQCEYHIFIVRHPFKDAAPDKMLQKLEQMKSALETAKLNPQSKAEIEKFISIAKNEASTNKAAQEKKENAAKQAKKSAKRWFVFDLLALGAMLFFPLIEIAGTPCNFFGLIEAICNGFAVGLCILLIIYIICILCIISELKDPPEAYPVIFTFVLAVGAVCLFGGSNYNTFIWLYIFIIPFVSFFMKK